MVEANGNQWRELLRPRAGCRNGRLCMLRMILVTVIVVNACGALTVSAYPFGAGQDATLPSGQHDDGCPPGLLAVFEFQSDGGELSDGVAVRLQRIQDHLQRHPELGLILGVCSDKSDDSRLARTPEQAIREFLVERGGSQGGSVTADRIFTRSDFGPCLNALVCKSSHRIVPLIFKLQDGEAGQQQANRKYERRCEIDTVFSKPPN